MESTKMSNMDPKKNSNSGQLNFNFMPEMANVFQDYLKDLNPEQNNVIEFDETNFEDSTITIDGADNSDAVVNDPFADDLKEGLFYNLNNTVQQEWEDLEDDVHRKN